MEHLYQGLGGLIGGLYLFSNFWDAIEQPMLEFVFLGIVPGTQYVVLFEQVLVFIALMLLLAIYRQYRERLKILQIKLLIQAL